MTSVVLDASAVLALVRDEPGADKVTPHVGRAAISAVNLQEVIEELVDLARGRGRELWRDYTRHQRAPRK